LVSRWYYKFCVNLCKKADKVITISEYSKNKIIEILKIPEEKIKVIYCGVDHNRFFPKKRKRNKKIKIGFLGGLTKQKNAINLIKAFNILADKNAELIIGGGGKEQRNLFEYAKKNEIKNIKFLGYVPDKDLPDFYRNLDLFVYPSFHEGFGLPILEAMACGCPVICSNRESLPEVVGNAGILIDPKDVGEISKEITRVMKDENLRKRMSQEGIKQANKFNWGIFSKEMLAAYKEVLK
jgi:glycosyltransferase involved in cell wall biosynthesis